MKHITHLLAFLLSAVMLVTCFVGCQKEPQLSLVPTPTGSPVGSISISVPTLSPTPGPTQTLSLTPTPSPTPTPTPTPTPMPEPPETASKQIFVYDVTEKRYICLEGEEEVIYPASTQKLLTIMYARTILEDDFVVTPGNELEMVGPNSSIAYIKSHHKLTVEQLIEGMMLPSGNDAALVLAAACGKKLDPSAKDGQAAVAVFMKGMNAYAKKIGATHSLFTDPSGYNEDQYTTLEDMALIAQRALNDQLIMKYARLQKDHVEYASGHVMDWQNTNACLNEESKYYLPEVIGLKTGSLRKDYTNLLLAYNVDGRIFLAGIYAEEVSCARFADAGVILEWIKSYLYD